ncbi:HK97 family phage prohead protease [Metabacillus indicus]|uniref:HK97 family phage prohead protease n=1 Tax=Metabacillus indicus TaxID=246786 RepID=UPI000A88EF04|nr:HK97 family phage prohead protease [Metabacillus indicus]
MKQFELRVKQVELRSNKNGHMVVSGYVNKTESFSEVMGVTKRFIEKISRGAFSRAIQNASRDIDFLAEHNHKQILASTRNGSLTLTEDSNGLFMTAEIVPTTYGKDYFSLIESQILKNLSFGFRTIKDSWKSTASGIYERTISELELFEVSVVRDPAYSQSTISARGINLVTEVDIPVSAIKNKEQNNMKTVHTYGQANKNEKRKFEVEQFKEYVEERNLQGSQQSAAVMGEQVYNGVVKKWKKSPQSLVELVNFLL